MVLTIIFIISGFSIILLIVSKKLEEKRQRPLFILKAISKSDIYMRDFYRQALHWYSDSKEKLVFLINKRVPMHSRNLLNKQISLLKEKRDRYIGNMRDSRLLKKSDGISEFFKNMSSVEKGNGEINDDIFKPVCFACFGANLFFFNGFKKCL